MQTKNKLKKNRKSHKNLGEAEMKKPRSKSKRRIDEEKENRR